MGKRLWERLWQLLFPDQCHGCSCFGTLLCHECSAQFAPYAGDFPACGATKFTIAFVYAGVLRSAILAVKYARQRRLGSALGDLLARQPWQSGDAVVVPLPGSAQRVAQRGYDQAVVLAHAVATARQLPVSHQLVRVRQTTAQAKLQRGERQRNVAGAFVWQGTAPPPQIILIDDICTTGATMTAAIAAIQQAGPCAVHVVVLARGMMGGDSYVGNKNVHGGETHHGRGVGAYYSSISSSASLLVSRVSRRSWSSSSLLNGSGSLSS